MGKKGAKTLDDMKEELLQEVRNFSDKSPSKSKAAKEARKLVQEVLEESKVERRGSPTSSTRRTKRKAPRQADSSDDEKNVDADGVSEAPKRHRLSSSSLDTTVSGVERVGGGAKGEKENERKARKRKEKKRQQKKRKHDERRTDNSEPDSGIEPSKPGRGELLKGGKKLKTSGKER